MSDKSWRPDDWVEDRIEKYGESTTDWENGYECGADAMLEAKEKTHRSAKEVRLKLIEVEFEYMSVPQFVDWMYGEVEC